MRVLLDANVCLDILLKRKSELTRFILEKNEEGAVKIYISTSIVHILAYFTGKNYNFDFAQQLLVQFLDIAEVLDIPHKEVQFALSNAKKDMEDAVQKQVAIFHKLDCIVTNDEDFIKLTGSLMPIISVASFYQKFQSL